MNDSPSSNRSSLTSVPLVSVPLGRGNPLVEARFIERPNQFVVVARLEGNKLEGNKFEGNKFEDKVVRAHMPDRGRLLEVLVPDRPLLLAHCPAPHRKTDYQAVAAVMDDRLVSLDTHLPNRLVACALEADCFEEVAGFEAWQKEKTIGGSRFDFLLEYEHHRTILEIKSVARLDQDGAALFPDAPTTRGRRHVEELAELVEPGQTRTALCFLVQGEHADRVEIDTDIDPKLHQALVKARAKGVELYARRCRLDRTGVHWGGSIPVVL